MIFEARLRSATLAAVFCVLSAGAPRPCFADDASLDFLNRILNGREAETDKNLQRLSSGRILLTDDPAGYAIDQTLEKYVRGLDRVVANQADMISYYKVQDSFLGGIIEILQRIRELVFKRMGGILSDSDKEMIDAEIGQQYDQILYTLGEAEFNKKKLFGDLMESDAVKSSFKEEKYLQPANVDELLDFFIRQRAYVGAKVESIEFSLSGETIASENMTKARTQQDVDIAAEMAAFKRNQLLMLVNILMLPRVKE